jgi:hypothetical protein
MMQSPLSRYMATNTVASIEAAEEPTFNETVVFVNISEHGARFISRRKWPAGKRVILSDSLANFRATAEVVYCAPQSSNFAGASSGHPDTGAFSRYRPALPLSERRDFLVGSPMVTFRIPSLAARS